MSRKRRYPPKFELPKLREIREAKGMTVRELADKAGLSTETLYGLEVQGRKAWLRTREKLATALDCHPWELQFTKEQALAAVEEDRRASELISLQLAAMTDEQLEELLNPTDPARREVRDRIVRALEHADNERQGLEDTEKRMAVAG